MIIQSSAVEMNSARRYNSKQLSYQGLRVWNNKTDESAAVDDENVEQYVDDKTKEGLTNSAKKVLKEQENGGEKESSFENLMDRFKATQNVKQVSVQERIETINKIRRQTLDYLLYLLFGRKIDDSSYASEQSTSYNDQDYMQNQNQSYGGVYSSWNYYSEEETTCFKTKGTVVTADGKSIDFNVDLEMSRSFTEITADRIDFGAAQYKDPLVINLDCAAADVTDQKFYFDIDADGKEDYISQLGPGSGYLAFDKNGDGIINDGSELFGTASGNGFADLARYDSDGNGWIDEADEIFSKLKIWCMDKDGNSSLISLGKAGVGAIYLGSADTEFSLNDMDNSVNAVVRKTGLFLYENGGTGTIQQLDLAT